MNAQSQDHSPYKEWLHLDLDDALRPAQRSELREHLMGCRSCQIEQHELAALDEFMIESKIDVRADFHTEIMSSLPRAAWESRHPRNWIAAASIVLILILGSGLLIASGSDSLGSTVPVVAAFAAVGELFRSAALAGAGLLGASWKGLGLAFQELLDGSIWNLLALGVLVIGVDVLLVRMLRKNRRSTEKVAARRRDPN